MSPKKSTVLLIFLLFSNLIAAQSWLSHEIGFIAGPIAFQSDFGQRNHFRSNAENRGFALGIVHYANFSSGEDYTHYFNDHFKVRTELSYSSADLEHFGKWIEGTQSLGKQQLKAMSSTTKVANVGLQAEYHFTSIHDFENTIGKFGPYLSIGVLYSYYNAKVSSTMGTLGDPAITFPKYLTPTEGRPYGFSSEKKGILSLEISLGTRYRLNKKTDLLVDVRHQYFTNDWVDGLNPNPAIYKENQATDRLAWLSFGYIYYLEY